MRMEDLDPDRSKAIYAEAALEDLRWLGIRWFEGPDKGGPFAPYVQSKRRPIYLAAWRRLLRRAISIPVAAPQGSCLRRRRSARKQLTGAPGMQSNGKLEPLDDEPIYPGTCRQLMARAPNCPARR